MVPSQATRALWMAAAAGFSTLLGAFLVFVPNKKQERLVTVSLAFAAGVMISVSFTDMLPNAGTSMVPTVGKQWAIVLSVLFLALGVVSASMLDRFVPHGPASGKSGRSHQNLYRLGIVSFLAIALHNFPEGIATFMAGYQDAKLGTAITVAIALHNIPEGISVAMPIYLATGNKRKAFWYAFLSGVAEPAGALLTFLLLRSWINGMLLGCVFAMVAGMMLYIALEELLPTARSYGHPQKALAALFVGICLMPLTHVLTG